MDRFKFSKYSSLNSFLWRMLRLLRLRSLRRRLRSCWRQRDLTRCRTISPELDKILGERHDGFEMKVSEEWDDKRHYILHSDLGFVPRLSIVGGVSSITTCPLIGYYFTHHVKIPKNEWNQKYQSLDKRFQRPNGIKKSITPI